MPRRVTNAEEGQSIREAECWSNALNDPREDSKFKIGIDAEADNERPYGEPSVTDDEHLLVAEDITKAAGEENESPHGQGETSNQPCELWRAGNIEAPADRAEQYEGTKKLSLCKRARLALNHADCWVVVFKPPVNKSTRI